MQPNLMSGARVAASRRRGQSITPQVRAADAPPAFRPRYWSVTAAQAPRTARSAGTSDRTARYGRIGMAIKPAQINAAGRTARCAANPQKPILRLQWPRRLLARTTSAFAGTGADGTPYRVQQHPQFNWINAICVHEIADDGISQQVFDRRFKCCH